MIETFHAQGFLLAEHKVFESLAQVLLDSTNCGSNKRWSIVCERKEDLLAVRTQIFSLLRQRQSETNPQNQLKQWAGISLYTPDTLVRNFCLTLSHNKENLVGRSAHRLLNLPFIDVVEQEKLVRLLLLRLGYALSDVAPLAKQILTLSDTPLPADETFLSLLLEVQSQNQTHKSISDIPDNSLRTICVAYQLAQKILSSHCRLQSFVSEYWNSTFKQNVLAKIEGAPDHADFLLPGKFLSDSLLWIAAPEYSRNANSSYRPGNFQAAYIDALRDGLFECRRIWQEHNPTSSLTWWARNTIETTEVTCTEKRAKIQVMGSYLALDWRFNMLAGETGEPTQYLLADLDTRALNVVRADGSGIHNLTPQDFDLSARETSQDKEWKNPALDRINTLHDEFRKFWDKLEVHGELIDEALKRYELSPALRQHGVTFELMLHRFFDSESYTFAVTDRLAQLPPALALLPGLEVPTKFVVLGAPHSTTAPSFHLRLLNAVFHLLRSKQVALDPIASEESYRGYWQSILARNAEVVFLIRDSRQLEDFPDYSRQWFLPPEEVRLWKGPMTSASAFEKWLGDKHRLHDERWPRLLKSEPTPDGKHKVGVTAFEDYVECPLQYYWEKLHGIAQESAPALQPDPVLTGQRAHAVAETFVQGLRQMSLLDETRHANETNDWVSFLLKIRDGFLATREFLSVDIDSWCKAFADALELDSMANPKALRARLMIDELAEVVFAKSNDGKDSMLSPIKRRLVRESVRRALWKLVHCELVVDEAKMMGTSNTIRAAFIEKPILYAIHPNLILTGRIDRVDSHPNGDRIIDYKTSKVSKKDPPLVLDPRLSKSTNKLSVQGGIYSLAWAEKNALDLQGADNERVRGVSAFTLVRLKTMDLERNPFATFAFDSPMVFKDETFDSMHAEYSRRAASLVAGDFSPRPLTSKVCLWCALQDVCPAKGQVGGDPE
ncbi:MAG: PD-(D/E)XK nuclease family protein [Silvanigrellaceae bacterium]